MRSISILPMLIIYYVIIVTVEATVTVVPASLMYACMPVDSTGMQSYIREASITVATTTIE